MEKQRNGIISWMVPILSILLFLMAPSLNHSQINFRVQAEHSKTPIEETKTTYDYVKEDTGKISYLHLNSVRLSGWYQDNNSWYYYTNNVKQKGWIHIGSTWYYLNSNGAMQIGWTKVGNHWYYMNSNGAMQTGWEKIGSQWYYMNSSGAMQTDWMRVGKDWYYMNPSGAMQTGWIKINTIHYYMNSSGRLEQTIQENKSEIDTVRFNNAFLKYVNQERARIGVKKLKYNQDLQPGVNTRLAEMLSVDDISHTRPNGTSCFTAFDYMKYNYRNIGENVGYNWYDDEYRQIVVSGKRTTEDLIAEMFFNQYKASQSHYENMICPKYDSMAVAAEIVENKDAYFDKMFSVMIFTSMR